MSDQTENNDDLSAASIIGGAASGVGAGLVATDRLSRRLFTDIHNPQTSLGKIYERALESEGTEPKALKRIGLKPTFFDDISTIAGGEKYIKLKAQNERIQKLALHELVLDDFLDGNLPPVKEIVFGKGANNTFSATFTYDEATHDKLKHVLDVPAEMLKKIGVNGNVISVEGLHALPEGVVLDAATGKSAPIVGEGIAALTEAIDSSKPGNWLRNAANHIGEISADVREIEGSKMLRKASGIGFGFQQMSLKGKAGVLGSAIAAAIVGGFALNALFGGNKHSDKVNADRAAPEGAKARA